jgi:hypothetical protein
MLSAPAVSTEVLGRLHYYRTVGGLPAHVDSRGRLAVTIGGKVRALILAEYWGYRLKDELAVWNLRGPIIWHPVQRLTMLTSAFPEEEHTPQFNSLLQQTDSLLVEPGIPIVLPTPGDGSRGWETPIRDLFRPTMATVLTAFAECVSRDR